MANYTLSHSGAQLDEAIGKVLDGYDPAVPSVEQATPVITVGTDGLITAKATQADGHVASGTKTATKQLNTQGAKTITPTTSEQIAVEAGVYTTGQIKVAASSGGEDIPAVEQATPVISVGADGLITATSTQEDGHVTAGTKTATKKMTTQAAKTVTPSASEQTAVSSGVFTTGDVKVSAVPAETKSVTSNGTYTPTSGKFFSSVTVNVPAETFNSQSKAVTPSESQQTVTPDSGYDGLSSVTVGAISSTYVGSAVPTQAAKTITPSDSEQVAVEAGVFTTGQIKVAAQSGGSGGVPSTITAGDTPVASSSELAYTTTSTSMTATGISITIQKAGTYRFKFSAGRTSTSGTWTTQLYKNGSAISGATATWSSYQGTCTADVSCAAGDVIQIYGRSRSTSYRLIVGQLVACIDWDTGL